LVSFTYDGFAAYGTKLVPWQLSLRIAKRGPDQSSAPKMLSYSKKMVKIGFVDPEIIGLLAVIKNASKIYLPASKKLQYCQIQHIKLGEH